MSIHLVFFRVLDGRPTDTTIVSQGLQTAIANILAIVVEMSLLSGIAVAYNQSIWRLFRRKHLKAATIDKLMTLSAEPWNLVRNGLYKKAPLEWLLACSSVLVPIAAIFPPGALNVVFRNDAVSVTQSVPSLNISDWGDGTRKDFARLAVFTTNGDLDVG